MKRIEFLFFVLAVALCACGKQPDVSCPDAEQEMVFSIGGEGIQFDVDTKATPVTSVSKVYWECLTGTSVTYAVTSGGYSVNSTSRLVSTGKYWPAAGATYKYRVSNALFSTSTGAISAVNTTDIVVGEKSGVTSNTCEVTLDHIFARTDTLVLNTQSGYTLSDVVWKIKSPASSCTGTAGKFSIGTGWSTAASDYTVLAEKTLSGTVTYNTAGTVAKLPTDEWLVPGTYTLTVTYKLTKGAYNVTVTKSADVTIEQGKRNRITGTAVGGSAQQITFTVTVAGWGSKNLTISNWN